MRAKTKAAQHMTSISEELDTLAISTLNNALEVISRGEELWTVVALASDDDFDLRQFSEDSPEECWQAARDLISAAPASVTAYALCYDGHAEVEFEGEDGEMVRQSSDALIVEFGERGATQSYSMITPYRSASSPEGFAIIGDTALTTECEQLLS